MSDIVERLREAARLGKPDGHMMLATSELYSAADEIERLRTDYVLLSDDFRELMTDCKLRQDERDELRRLVVNCAANLTNIVRMPNAEHVADAHNRAVQLMREATDPPKEPT